MELSKKNSVAKKHDRAKNVGTFSKKWWVHQVTRTAYNVAPDFSSDWVRLNQFRPHYINLSQEQKQVRELAIETSFYINKHKKIRILEWGFGPAILFVHGWAGRGLQFHKFISPLVAAGFSVVTFDHHGHGNSTPGSSSYLDFIHTTKIILENYGRFYGAVGHSMGASALLKCVEDITYPLKVGLIAPMSDVTEVLHYIQNKTSIYSPLFWQAIHKIEQNLGMTIEEAKEYNYTKIAIHCGLLIHDKKDRINSHDRSLEIHKNWSNSQLLSTHGLGHSRILNNEMVIQNVLKFMTYKSQTSQK